MGLTRRTRKLDNFKLSDHFDESTRIFLDSGAYSINKEGSKYSEDDALEYANGYIKFVAANLDRIDFASEFDADILGPSWLSGMREDFWHDIGDKFLPVYKSNDALDFRAFAHRYARIGLLNSEDIVSPFLNTAVMDTGVKLHGIAMTKMAEMKSVRWDSVGSTSWLSPSQYGDTFVWDGKRLRRFPKKYKEECRLDFKTYFEDHGFDSTKIEEDDTLEVLRLSVWSWQQFVNSINHTQVTQVANSPETLTTETDSSRVDQADPIVRNEIVVQPGRKLLPVLGVTYETRTEKDAEGNEVEVRSQLLSTPSSSGLLRCDNCIVQDKCPARTPGAECAYEIPVIARTQSQVDAIEDSMIEMQSQRVYMLRLIEQVNGGYPDPNLGPEMDRLVRMTNKKADRRKKGASFSIKADIEGDAPGMLAELFGTRASEKARELHHPPAALDVMEVLEAEIVND